MSSAKNLATCNLKDCVKISGSSFRWGFIWDTPLLCWRLLGEILDEVSMKNLSCQLQKVLFDLLTFPRGQSSRSIMDWSQGRTCRPNPGELGYVTLWQERDGPGMERKGALRGPDHQTTCAQIHQIPHTHRRKWNPCPGQRHQHRQQCASAGFGGWWVRPPCLDEVLWCRVALSSCKLPILPKQLLAILSWPQLSQSYLFHLIHLIPLHFGKGSYEASSLALAENHSSQTGKCDFSLSTFPPCFFLQLTQLTRPLESCSCKVAPGTTSSSTVMPLCTIAQGVVGKIIDFQRKGQNSQTVRESLFSTDNVLIYFDKFTDQKYRSIVSFDNLDCGQIWFGTFEMLEMRTGTLLTTAASPTAWTSGASPVGLPPGP